MRNMGERIKFLRRKMNLTQLQLAELVGVNRSLICKLETGNTIGSLSTLARLATAFGVSVSELLDEYKATGTEG